MRAEIVNLPIDIVPASSHKPVPGQNTYETVAKMSRRLSVDEDDRKINNPLQAVVLADSFTRTFRPMSLERPKVGPVLRLLSVVLWGI